MGLAKRGAVLLVVLAALGTAARAENGYRNVVNQPHATVADGPLGGVVLDVADPTRPVDRARALREATGAAVTRAAGGRVAPPWFVMLQQQGLIPRDHPLPVLPQTAFWRSNGRLLRPDLDASLNPTRAAGRQTGTLGDDANRLTFRFDVPTTPGETARPWSATQRQQLQTFLNDAQAALLRVYGPPAFANEVRILHDPSLNELNMVVYDATTNTIRIELLFDIDEQNPADTTLDEYDFYVLTFALLQAYRDDAAIFYDAWEAGMARAAQLLVISTVRPNFGFLARDFNLIFAAYDLLNQPGLESPTFLGSGAGSEAQIMREALGVVRAYMAQAAWLKVYAENPAVFAQFNDAYYRALAGNNRLPGDVPLLKTLLRGIVPEVEGLRLDDWYRRQHVLDTSVIPGAKLYVFAIPQKDFVTGEPTNTLPTNVYHYQVTTANEQRPLDGTVRFAYTAYDEFDLTDAVEGASGPSAVETGIGTAGNPAGIGSAVPIFINIAGDQGVQQQRILVDVQVNGMDRRLYYPYDVAIDDTRAPNQLYGLVTEGRQGELTIDIEGLANPLEADVVQGAFRVKIPSGLPVPAQATFTWTPDSGSGSQPVVIERNVMFLGTIGTGQDVANGAAVVVLHTPPETPTAFQRALPAGLQMITIPAFASRGVADENAAEVLGVDPERLLMARADNAVTGFEPYRQNDLYALWPNTPAFQPGFGYWVLAKDALTLSFDGVEANRDRPYRQHYPPGWVQIGNPWRDLPIQLGDLQVQAVDGEPAVSLAEAQSLGYVSSGVFRYDTAGGGYELVGANDVLEPYAGYWMNILADLGATVVYPNTASSGRRHDTWLTDPRGGRGRQASAPGTWQVRLVATTADHRDAANLFGVRPQAADGRSAFDVAEPPVFGPFVNVSFVQTGWGPHSGRYAVDLREADGTLKQWDVLVETNLPGEPITLSWPELAGVPADVMLSLEDLDSGATRFMRTSASYRFTSGPQGGTRRLRITAQRGSQGRLSIAGLNVQTTRAGGVVDYTLTQPAEVTLILRSPNGRVVRLLADGQASSRGTSRAAFVPRDEQGRPLPNGIYRLEMIAVAEDGQQARASRVVQVER